jgi:hypothetical protein
MTTRAFLFLLLLPATALAATGWEPVPVPAGVVPQIHPLPSLREQATSPIPEWGGRRLACRQEEEAYLDDQGNRHWVYRRQERFHLVR